MRRLQAGTKWWRRATRYENAQALWQKVRDGDLPKLDGEPHEARLVGKKVPALRQARQEKPEESEDFP